MHRERQLLSDVRCHILRPFDIIECAFSEKVQVKFNRVYLAVERN